MTGFFFSKEAICDMTFFSVWLIGNGYFTRSGHALILKPLSDEPVQNITGNFSSSHFSFPHNCLDVQTRRGADSSI